MRLEQFEYVDAVAKFGSMNAAAQQLHVSQQNISKSIKRLESELHASIFTRSRKGTYPTQQGQFICNFAADQMVQFRELKEQIYDLQRERLSGTIVVNTMNSGSCMIVPELLCEFYKSCPNVKLHIVESNVHEVIRQIEEQSADIGIITYCMLAGKIYPEIPDDLKLTTLLKGKWYYWVSTHSEYARKGYITLEEANRESILIDEAMDAEYLADLFQIFGLSVNLGYQSRNLHVLGKFVEENQGVFPDMMFDKGGLLYSYAFDNHSGMMPVPVRGRYEYNAVGYLVKKNEKMDSLMRFTLEYLNDFSKKEGMIICE